MDKCLLSSGNNEWETPQDFFDMLNKEFNFTLDPCCKPETAKCSQYYTPIEDGLKQPWRGSVFVNPPYGSEIGKWMKKAYEESQKGAIVVCLIPSRTDTKYWHDYCMHADEIRFVKGRLKFGQAAASAPFPSAVVVFNGKNRLKISTINKAEV